MTTEPALSPAAFALYQATLPVLQTYLERVHLWLEAAGQWQAGTLPDARAQKEEGLKERLPQAQPWLQMRLTADMLPLQVQVEIAANFALRTCWPLCGLPIPALSPLDPESGLDGLQQRLQHILQALAALQPDQFAGCEARVLHSRAGAADVYLPAADFVHLYAMPNFFFHCSLVYALLRQSGLPLGKQDFDGLHRYPAP